MNNDELATMIQKNFLEIKEVLEENNLAIQRNSEVIRKNSEAIKNNSQAIENNSQELKDFRAEVNARFDALEKRSIAETERLDKHEELVLKALKTNPQ